MVSCFIMMISILFILLFSGCYSALHTAQVIDGPSMALAYRPIHPISMHPAAWAGGPVRGEAFNIQSSVAIKYGWAASEYIAGCGLSVGLSCHRETYSSKGDPDDNGWFPSVDIYVQGPKNPIIDWGIGLFYITLGRNIGDHFAIYCELRKYPLLIFNKSITTGIQFTINKHISILTEANLIGKSEYIDDGVAKVMTVGIVLKP